MRMHRPKIKPIIDVPLMVQIENPFGQESNSQYTGLEYRYQVTFDGQPHYLYVPEEGRDAIAQVEPAAGDFIELLKQKQNGEFVWSAYLIGDAAEPQPRPQPQPQRGGVRMLAPQPYPQQSRQVTGHSQQGRANGYAHAMARPVSEPRPSPHRQEPPRQAEEQHLQEAVYPIKEQLSTCLRMAVDAWEETRVYAESKGVNLEYTSEDVRATGLSVYIGRQRGGGR